MTAPKNNFYCATGLALMSEPAVYGAGIIGIVRNSPQQSNRSNKAIMTCNTQARSVVRSDARAE
jgi:hypothetical protein